MIVALVLVVIAISVFGTLYYKRKVKKRAIKKAEARKAALEGEMPGGMGREEQKVELKDEKVRIAQRNKPLKEPFVNAESSNKKTGLESLNEFNI
ncbi:MAG: hypothetical protein ACTSSK_15565 [Candidatus Heimdallarchaeota archaeon]